MLTAIDDVHHRSGQNEWCLVGLAHQTRNVPIKRDVAGECRGAGDGHGNTENRVRSEPPFVWCVIEFNHSPIDATLIHNIHSAQCACDFSLDVSNRLENAFAPIAFWVAVAEFQSLTAAR